MSATARDYTFNVAEAIAAAALNARGEWESGFIADMTDRWKGYGLDMYLTDKQAKVLCRIARIEYAEPKPWQQQQKQHFNSAWEDAVFGKKPSSGMSPELLKRLIILCHPDKHQGSEMATKVTQELLTMRRSM